MSTSQLVILTLKQGLSAFFFFSGLEIFAVGIPRTEYNSILLTLPQLME